ncbi:response regulator transcription factor [uncultured Nocardioides sp.]|uniref:winged helix-turn-helix transcriptional regulator n=1 Tax=uncultured Nocardioides sp. TaxID=198441 RepID=UPI0026285E32|nr:response regulator transcription factor [uncultured Nocardioides sp.]
MGTPLTAVIADDDPDITDLIDVVLGSVGFRVVHAQNGADAVEAVRQHAPVLTTMDVSMPGMDGLSALRQLREFSATYLIMITSRSTDDDVIAAFEAGADDYLVKPFSPRELQLRAEAMLRRAASAPQVEPEPEQGWAVAAAREFRESLNRDATPAPVDPDPGAPLFDEVADVVPPPLPPVAPVAPVTPVTPAVPPAPAAPAPVAAPAPPVQRPVPAEDDPAGGVVWQGDLAQFGPLVVDTRGGAVQLAGRRIAVPAEELDLLVALMRTGRRVRSRADLVLAMRGDGATSHFVNEADKRVVDQHVASLQQRLGDDPANPRVVETVRGVGFRLARSTG